jgi:hypothetical protein
MKIIKHMIAQPFVFSTGLAALFHSTWSLGTLFSGKEPYPQLTPAWFAWVVPAFLIAFALDVGQIVTSAEIRGGQKTRMKYATFAVFAVATYYLQWLYIAHHMPNMELAKGVRETWSDFATVLRDAAIWIIPALLPLSTLLYTFSGHEEAEIIPVVSIEPVQVKRSEAPAQLAMPLQDDSHVAQCPACGWMKSYDNPDSARRGLATHQSKHCTAMHPAEGVLNGSHAE